MKKLILFIVLIATANVLLAQDVIVKKDSTKVECKITEISDYEIKYVEWDNQSGPLYIVGVDKIAYVKFANGKVTSYNNHINSISTEADANGINRKNIIKVSPFSTMTGHLDFEYERTITNRISCVAELGIVGIETIRDYSMDAYGGFVGGGIRLYKNQAVRQKGTFYNSNFSGLYAQAKLGFEVYNYDFQYYTYLEGDKVERTINENAIGGSLMFGLGYQLVFASRVSIDAGGSLGYVVSNKFTYLSNPYNATSTLTKTVVNDLFHAGGFDRGYGLALDGWLRIGFLF